jgi:dynein light chain LC8-type
VWSRHVHVYRLLAFYPRPPRLALATPPSDLSFHQALAFTMSDINKQDATTALSSTDTGSGSGVGSKDTSGGGPKAIIKNVDMSEDMQQESVDIATGALEKYNIEKDIAAQIKKEFDRRHGPTWHVVVGKNFGSYVTHGQCSSSSVFISAEKGNRVDDCMQKPNTSSTFTSARSPSSSGSHRRLLSSLPLPPPIITLQFPFSPGM